MSSNTGFQTRFAQYTMEDALNYIRYSFDTFEEEKKLWKNEKEVLNGQIRKLKQERNIYQMMLHDILLLCNGSDRYLNAPSQSFCSLPDPLMKQYMCFPFGQCGGSELSDNYRIAEIRKVFLKHQSALNDIKQVPSPSTDGDSALSTTPKYSPHMTHHHSFSDTMLSSSNALFNKPLSIHANSPVCDPSPSAGPSSRTSLLPSSIGNITQHRSDSSFIPTITETSNVKDDCSSTTDNARTPENTTQNQFTSALKEEDANEVSSEPAHVQEDNANMKISLNEQILQEDEDMGNESPSTEEMSSSKHKQRETVIFNSSRRSSLFSAHYISNESRFSMESASIGMPIGFCPLSPVADVKDSEETDNDRFPFLRRNIPPTPTKNNDNVEIHLSPTSSPSSIGSTPINSEPIENNASQNATPSEAQVAVSVERRRKESFPLYQAMEDDDNSFHYLSSAFAIYYHTSPIRSVSCHPTLPLLLSGSDEGVACLWKVDKLTNDLRPCRTFGSHLGSVLSSAFVPSFDAAVTGGADGRLCVWSIPFDSLDQPPASSSVMSLLKGSIKAHNDMIWSVVSHPTHAVVVSCSSDNSVKLWNFNDMLDTQNLSPTLLNYVPSLQSPRDLLLGSPTKAEFSSLSNNSLGIGTTSGNLSLVDIEKNKMYHSFPSYTPFDSIYSVSCHPHYPLFITGTKSGSLFLYDIRDDYPVTSFKAHNDSISGCLVPDGFNTIITSSYENKIRVWDIRQQTCLQEIEQPHDSIFDESISGITYVNTTGMMISSGVDQTLVFYNLN